MNTSNPNVFKFYTLATAGVFLIAAYLCLVNLDYAALWHDEGPTAVHGEILLQQGDITGWDGRNLMGHTMLNEDLRSVWPPLMYALNAAGFAIFGIDETGARIVHAIIGIATLGVFYLLLRQHLPSHPRLVFFIFTFAAWSAQLLLYFRQSRYFSMMVFALFLLFYLYERYWQSKNPAYLPAAAIVAALSFFNHYAGGAATMLSLAAYHIFFRGRATSRREWGLFALCGAGVVAVGAFYLAWRPRRRAQWFSGFWRPSRAVSRRFIPPCPFSLENVGIHSGTVHRGLDFLAGFPVVRRCDVARLDRFISARAATKSTPGFSAPTPR